MDDFCIMEWCSMEFRLEAFGDELAIAAAAAAAAAIPFNVINKVN